MTERREKENRYRKTCVGWTRIKKKRVTHSSPNYSALPLLPFWNISVYVSCLCVCWCVCSSVCVLFCCLCGSVCLCVGIIYSLMCLCWREKWLVQCLSLCYLMCECVIFGASRASFCDSLLHPVQFHQETYCILPKEKKGKELRHYVLLVRKDDL